MVKRYQIELDGHDLGQVLDGLEVRAESWRRTADFLRTGEMPEGELFIIEDCSDAEEAEELAARYGEIIKKIQSQMKDQVVEEWISD
jgi:hypothetical protein